MTDPCGIVDTIQTVIEDSAAPVGCIMALDTASPTTGDTADDTASSAKAASNESDKSKTSEGQDGNKADDSVAEDESKTEEKDSAETDEKESKSKKGGLLRRGWDKIIKKDHDDEIDEEKKEEPPKMAAVSDLSDPNRKICVVTTAGLPWRTGTAVNPLARALYLTRGRPKYSVTLMIPWLETREEQAKVYGSNIFETPEEQEEWTRKYSRERILKSTSEDDEEAVTEERDDSKEEETGDEVDNLQIRFYPAKYHTLLGSIFATVDICALIPQEEADVAILEEPEHLTWFRSLPPSSSGSKSTPVAPSAMESMMDNDNSCGSCAVGSDEEKDNENDASESSNHSSEEDDHKKLERQAIIGWTAKFSYVVGILHTNYSAYMRQYGLGASIVTASALQALSSVCVRAYTHRLIRLSDTLPELDQSKEITCNVHGVRSEFFVEDTAPATEVDSAVTETAEGKVKKVEDEGTEPTASEGDSKMDESDYGNIESIDGNGVEIGNSIEEEERFQPEPIYFIGKVIWAKGFDKLLEIEDLFRKENGEYFPIDVYGSGGDFEAISRAFLGRSGLAKRAISSDSVKSLEGKTRDRSKSPVPSKTKSKDRTAALLFSKEGNLRGQIDDLQTIPSNELVVEVQTGETPVSTDSGTPSSARNYPKEIIDHLGEKTKETGTGVTKAISKLSEKISNLGFRSLYREETDSDISEDCSTDNSLASKFRFDPPKSRYELRRHAIPARFLGVKDHALLRDIPGHKIFVNLSITEVLCTTTAEAMAMGKFVIIPEHPSNTFFLQFPNCLAYGTKKECVEKIKFALENDPAPLSVEDKHKLTWEGANVRLYEASLMTETEAEERNKKTGDFARLHMDTMKTGAFFQGLWSRGSNKKPIIKEEKIEEDKKETEEEPQEKEKGMGFCKI